jgi:alginate O-acetyltransferase complex protein AlgI
LLGGLWHGASWSFMVWGGLHGLSLVVHLAWTRSVPGRWLALNGGGWWRLASIAITFHVVCLAWAFFRVPRFSAAVACLKAVVRFEPAHAFAGGSANLAVWLLVGIYAAVAFSLRYVLVATGPEKLAARAAGPIGFRTGLYWGGAAGLGVLAWLLAPSGEVPPFIYFQF